MNERTNTASIGDLKPTENLPAVRETSTELAVAFGAAQAKSAVEARYVMALRQPRNMAVVRERVLDECKRPGFAQSAWYVKPIGDGVEGLSIRFAEAALRCLTNVLVESAMLYEDAEKEVHRVTITDLESNLTYPMDVRVSKTVERQKIPDGQVPISQRKNSWGKWIYTVTGTEDDIANKRGAAISKAVRTLALRIIPGDIQDEAESVIKKIRKDETAKDPGAEQKKIADGFHDLGVPVAELIEFVGHPLNTCSPAELVKLRALYIAIKDGEATWAQAVENKKAEGVKEPPKEPTQQQATGQEAATLTSTAEGTVVSAAGDGHPPAARKRRPAATME